MVKAPRKNPNPQRFPTEEEEAEISQREQIMINRTQPVNVVQTARKSTGGVPFAKKSTAHYEKYRRQPPPHSNNPRIRRDPSPQPQTINSKRSKNKATVAIKHAGNVVNVDNAGNAGNVDKGGIRLVTLLRVHPIKY
jgi:hypothetical protein